MCVATASAIESGEALPRRVPRNHGRLGRRTGRLRHRLADGEHEPPRDLAGIRVVGVREHDDSDLVVELERREGRVAGIPATVPDIGAPVNPLNVEAEPRACGPVLLDGPHAVHLAPGAGADHLRAATCPPAEVGRHELGHVFHIRGDAGRRRHPLGVHERHHLARSIRHATSVRHGKSRHVPVHARVAHADRLVDVALDVVRPPLATHLLDHEAGHGIREVGVLPPHRRGERSLSVGVQRAQLIFRRERERLPVVARLALESRAVRQQLLDRDRAVVLACRLRLEPGQVGHDRIVEAQLSLLAQLHDRDGREQLAVRRHAEFGLRRHRELCLEVGEAEAGGPDELLVVHHADSDPRESAVRDLSLHPGGEETLGAQDVRVGGDGRGGLRRERVWGERGGRGDDDEHGDGAGARDARPGTDDRHGSLGNGKPLVDRLHVARLLHGALRAGRCFFGTLSAIEPATVTTSYSPTALIIRCAAHGSSL